MKMRFAVLGMLTVFSFGISSITQAAAITYNFTASNFQAYKGSSIPDPFISGSITLDGSTVTQVNLAIGTHVYSSGEVGYDKPSSSNIVFGGILHGLYEIDAGTDDFYFNFDPTTNTFKSFDYTLSGNSDIFDSYTGTVVPSPVPIPATFWLFGSGLIGLLTAGRKLGRRTQAS